MNAPATLRVLLADDHAIVREGLRSLLERSGEMVVVAEAADGAEAVALFRHHRPDLVFMDLRMPEVDGVEATRRIRADHPRARIVVLTTFDGDEDVYRAVQAGASAYLRKDTSRQELLEVARRVAAGLPALGPEMASRLAERLRREPLSRREQEVLALLAAGSSNRAIARTLGIAVVTVKTHVASILEKLQASSRTQAALIAIRQGMVRPR